MDEFGPESLPQLNGDAFVAKNLASQQFESFEVAVGVESSKIHWVGASVLHRPVLAHFRILQNLDAVLVWKMLASPTLVTK